MRFPNVDRIFSPKRIVALALFVVATCMPAPKVSAQPVDRTEPNYVLAFNSQLQSVVAALKEQGVQPNAIGALFAANSDPYSTKLEGGHFDFVNPVDVNGKLLIDLECPNRRCENGLDFSHNDGTFHRDTANPFNFPIGTFKHLSVDVIYGHFVKFLPPR